MSSIKSMKNMYLFRITSIHRNRAIHLRADKMYLCINMNDMHG